MYQESESRSQGKSKLSVSFERFATSSRADFRFAPLNVFLLVVVYVLGLTVHLNVHEFSMEAVYLSLGSAMGLTMLLRLTQVWEAAVFLGTAACLGIFWARREVSGSR